MRFARPSPVLLAVHLLGPGLWAGSGVVFIGGDVDDQAFARAAAGLKPSGSLGEGELAAALDAIRATDRFRKVEGTAERIVLDPWPALAGIEWRGDAPGSLRRTLFPGLRKGERFGDQRLEALRAQAQDRMVAAGYPKAVVRTLRTEGDTRIVLDVASGPPNLILGVEVVGKTGTYTAEELIQASGVIPQRSLWNREFELECMRRLRKKLVKGRRYEARVDLDWDAGGELRITVDVGPRIKLRAQGTGLGWTTSLKDMVPLARADRYSPELLDEGERRIVRLFRSRGHLDPQVSHRRDVVRSGPDGPEEVVITYILTPGPVSTIGNISFEGNKAITQAELAKAAGSGKGLFNHKARPEVMDAVESRLQAFYESRGFTEARIRRHVDLKGTKADLVFRIREGRQRLVSKVELVLPQGGFGDAWGLGSCLPLLFSERSVLASGDAATRIYHSDRREMAGVEGTLRLAEVDGGQLLTLTFNRPIPLLKGDFFRVYTAIRQQHLVGLGVVRPVVRSQIVDLEDGNAAIRIEVPDQPQETVHRVVVQGADRTRARAVLREIALKPGDPLDQDKLSRAQGRLGGLGAFSRVDLTSLGEGAPEGGPPSPWKAGDLLFHTEERSPWVITNSLGYDKSQGYYLGLGVQRLNVAGMGRTLDLNIRAGDGTINNPTMRDIFPTGQYTRSLDSYALAYTDPWFAPGLMENLLPDRTAFRAEGAYIQEQRYIYQVHRRRVLTSLRWPLSSRVNIEVGYRFERVEVSKNIDGITDDDLAKIARYPARAVISSPYVQIVRDTRDNAFDPTSGTYSVARFEAATQMFLTSKNSSFLKLDLRNQWTWPVGYKAEAGVVALGLRLGVARPTASSSQDLPLSERFFAGGSGTMRGVEPDFLGPLGQVPIYDNQGNQTGAKQQIPLGGQALIIANLEYRFPIFGPTVWGEVFVDSGQVYQRLQSATYVDGTTVTTYATTFPPIRTALGLGVIFKVGVPLKLEYAADVNRIFGRPRSDNDRNTQLRNVLISAGFQF